MVSCGDQTLLANPGYPHKPPFPDGKCVHTSPSPSGLTYAHIFQVIVFTPLSPRERGYWRLIQQHWAPGMAGIVKVHAIWIPAIHAGMTTYFNRIAPGRGLGRTSSR